MSRPYHNPELIIKLYTIDNLSSMDIAKQIGISDVAVLKWLKRYNIPVKPKWTFTYKNIKVTPELEKQICELYTEWMSSRQISKKVNICPTTTMQIVNRNKIKPHSKNFNAKQWSESHMWKGWISCINTTIRTQPEVRKWKKQVLKKDGYKCIQCWATTELEVDHIIPLVEIKTLHNITHFDKSIFIKIPLLTDINNGRTLCKLCHKATDTYGWKVFKH